MKAQNKVQSACDVKIYSDKGSLALRFPLRHNALWEALDGKSLKGKPKCLGIGKYGYSADEPDDWKRAGQIAIAIESDLDHPEWEKLFDITLAKYGLGGGKYAKLASITQLPGTVPALPEITVGEMWEAYLEWKKTVVEETTFKHISTTFTNAINGRVWNGATNSFTQNDETLSTACLDNAGKIKRLLAGITLHQKKYLTSELNQAFDFHKSGGMLVNKTTENPFVLDKYSIPAVTTQQKYASKIVNGEEKQWHEVTDEKELENDRRAFSKDERDTIIAAFYNATRESQRQFAELFEFLFLTGCRPCEAYSLYWNDIDFTRNLIRFRTSLGVNTKKIKDTKTGEIRLFYFRDDSRIKSLLTSLKESSSDNELLIFRTKNNQFLSHNSVHTAWIGYQKTKILKDGTEKTYRYPGIVTQLAEQGMISSYLSPYHTRHTYITLTAHANSANNNALLHIATSCGNSVDVILRHYLGVSESVELVEV